MDHVTTDLELVFGLGLFITDYREPKLRGHRFGHQNPEQEYCPAQGGPTSITLPVGTLKQRILTWGKLSLLT